MKASPEIEAIVRRLLSARARGDVEVPGGLYSGSEYLRAIGSDEHEWMLGPRESVGITKAHWGELGSHDSEVLRIEAFEEEGVGWAAVEERRTSARGSVLFRLTLVFRIEAGSWKIVQSHLSAPVPNMELAGVELTRTLSDLLTSIDAESELSLLAGQSSGTSTFVFTDIVDSTPLSQSMTDRAFTDLINDHLDTLRTVVVEEGGSVVKTLGDGGMYAFESGSSALKAAIRIQQAVTTASESRLQVRIGVHTGDVIRTEGDYLGLTVNKAARVAAAAEGGQVLVSSTTAGLVNSSEFEFGPPMTVELKGIEGTHQLQPLNWTA